MIEEIQNNMDKIADACVRHRVKALYLFGSATRLNDFDKDSDLDFLVEFLYNYDFTDDSQIGQHVNNIDLLKSNLKDITQRDIDLLQEKNIRNKFLKYFINKEKKLIYGVS